MADAFNGRNVRVHIGGVGTAAGTISSDAQEGVMSRTITRNRSEVDVTSDDSEGWREVLHEAGIRSVDLSLTGVMNEDNFKTLIDRFYDDANTDNYSLRIDHPNDSASSGNFVRESGKFFLQSLEVTGEHDGHVAFSATFLSSGEVTVASVSNP